MINTTTSMPPYIIIYIFPVRSLFQLFSEPAFAYKVVSVSSIPNRVEVELYTSPSHSEAISYVLAEECKNTPRTSFKYVVFSALYTAMLIHHNLPLNIIINCSENRPKLLEYAKSFCEKCGLFMKPKENSSKDYIIFAPGMRTTITL